MPKVVIDLTHEWGRLLKEKALQEDRSEEELVQEAVYRYLQDLGNDIQLSPNNFYQPFLQMIGMVEKGPADASVNHEFRPSDEG